MLIDISDLTKRVHAVFPDATLRLIGDESQFRYAEPSYFIELVVRRAHHVRVPLRTNMQSDELAYRMCVSMADYLIRNA